MEAHELSIIKMVVHGVVRPVRVGVCAVDGRVVVVDGENAGEVRMAVDLVVSLRQEVNTLILAGEWEIGQINKRKNSITSLM